MKFFLSLVLGMFCAGCYAADDLPVRIALNQSSFEITLPANPTTGYQWTIKSFDKKLLRLVSSQYLRPKSALVGAGGRMTFRFSLNKTVQRPTFTLVKLIYARPWEPTKGTMKVLRVNFDK